MLNVIFRSVGKWPGKTTPAASRRKTLFRATYIQTLDLLEAELHHLDAQNIVIQAFFTREQLRNDGWPKGGQNPSAPGIIVSFTSRGEAYSYPCDNFTWWTVNLRAIALALEALRKIDRYGVTGHGEQYAGFKQIASGSPPPREKMTAKTAAEALAALSGDIVLPEVLLDQKRLVEAVFDVAKKRVHPDARGGSHEEFIRLQEAAETMAEYHKARGQGA
jgi:hypothetical protein